MRGIVALVVLRAAIASAVLAVSFAYGAHCNAADLFSPVSFAQQSEPPELDPGICGQDVNHRHLEHDGIQFE